MIFRENKLESPYGADLILLVFWMDKSRPPLISITSPGGSQLIISLLRKFLGKAAPVTRGWGTNCARHAKALQKKGSKKHI